MVYYSHKLKKTTFKQLTIYFQNTAKSKRNTMMIRSILTTFSLSSSSRVSFSSIFVTLLVVVTIMNNNIVPTQGLANVRSGSLFHQRNSLISATRRMMMLNENSITITKKTNKNTQSNTGALSAKQQQQELTTLATVYRQEMIDLEYEIFFLEEDLMHLSHQKKELLMMRQ